MTTIDAHAHGSFCWVELGTSDLPAAKAFYGEVLGWTVSEQPAGEMGTYTMFHLGEHEVAGAYELNAEMKAAGVPPHWMGYVAVPSADDAARRVGELGGTVTVAPFDVMDIGRMAVFQDPAGATCAVWEAKGHKGSTVVDVPGTPAWHEHMTKDVAASTAFYTHLFGWDAEAKPMTTPDGQAFDYTIFKQGETQVAGMMGMGPEFGEMPSHWMVYLKVADLDAAHAKVTELGGKELIPILPIPDVGRFCQVLDPTGAAVSLMDAKIPG